jgi:hypothetical protein
LGFGYWELLAMNIRRVCVLLAANLSLLALAGGCADLSAISDFSAISANAAENTTLVKEYVETPKRLEAYETPAFKDQLEAQAKAFADDQPRMIARLTAIQAYMIALGKLASDKAVNYDTNIDAVKTAVTNAKFASGTETDAGDAIAKILVKAVTDGWRRWQLHDLIDQANQPLHDLISAQIKILQEFYGDQDISNEELAINLYYGGIIAPAAATEPLGRAAVDELRDNHLHSIEAEKAAVDDYVKVLQKIAAAHQKLYEQRDNLSNKQLLTDIDTAATDISTILKQVNNF